MAQQSCENLQMFVLLGWGGVGWGGGGGHNTLQTSVRFRDFEELYLC